MLKEKVEHLVINNFFTLKEHRLYIKKMVCPRCIDTVRDIFIGQGIAIANIRLGEVVLAEEINESQKTELAEKLKSRGFELLQDNKSKLIGQIKSIIIEQIHYNDERLKVNFSTLLSEKLNHEYSSLSRLFSSVESITIEKFILKQKIEKVKELISYDELTLSEISFQMGYSSVAHLSAQFKKETGMTTTEFKKMKSLDRKTLDEL